MADDAASHDTLEVPPARVVFLGTGDAFSLSRACASVAVEFATGEALLLDAASGKELLVQLGRARLTPVAVRTVVLTHQHPDHAGGLVSLLLHRLRDDAPLTVYCPAGALAPLQGVVRTYLPFLPQVMADRLRWHACAEGDEVDVAGGAGRLAFFRVDHGDVDALGVVLHVGARRLVYSGDTRPCEALVRSAARADVLIHDASDLESEVGPTSERPSSVHSTAADVGRIGARAGVGQLMLTHVGDASAERVTLLEAEARKHYRGPVRVAADLDDLMLK